VPVYAQDIDENINIQEPERELLERDLVSYPASYFDRFNPITAVDMVNQVPGFQLDGNNFNIRGFSEAAGNVLIDDRRPSTKRDSLNNILSRIPATSVRRIELIRGQVRNIDMRGESVVVNLVLREGIPAAVQWEAAIRRTFGHGPLIPIGRFSLSDNWNGIDYNLGFSGRRNSVGRKGTENIFDPQNGLVEGRLDVRGNRNLFLTANINLSSWLGETFFTLNTSYQYAKRRLFTDSQRTDVLSDTVRDLFFDDHEEEPNYEVGMDFERELLSNFLGKGIFLFARNEEDILDTQTDSDSNGMQTLFREARGGIDTTEIIGRLEFDWTGLSNHVIQANLERAYNVLESSLTQTDDTGGGPVFINVPGANSRIEEIRWDFLVKDTWLLGRFEIEYGLGAESSTLKQTGDAELLRDFFFLKPQTILSYSSVNTDQTRLSLNREVSQLDLEDFVSATEFLDDDIALGNPNIQPDATWKLELSHERRFGGESVIKLTVFHNWISDVLDLLPITSEFEAPGNIGNGRRWGLLWESTIPMDWLGLKSAKLDIKARWQDSKVTDPVTGQKRILSVGFLSAGPVTFDIENEYGYEFDYRQDFQEHQISWGWTFIERGKQLRFKVNELETYNEGGEFKAFIETTRWFGIKMRILGEDLLNFSDTRNRRIYISERELSPLDSIQFRDRTRGVRLQFTLSGNF
jgi:hypothetical protein